MTGVAEPRVGRTWGIAAALGFLGCVLLANYSISHWGTAPAFPGGPYTVTLLGWTAPSGVLFVGIAFTLRDLAQMGIGRWAVLAAIVVGAFLSAIVASPELALASGLAFGASETLDLICYTPLADRGHWWPAVALSNTVGSLVDSVLFLLVAFGSLEFLEGQFALKTLMIVPALIVLAPLRLSAREA